MPSEQAGNQDPYDSPFARLLEMVAGISQDGRGSALMQIKEKHKQAAGAVQGGLIVTLADFAFHRAVRSLMEPGQLAVTVELKLNFIAPAREGNLTATANIVSRGRRLIVGEMEVTNQDGALIAKGLGTYSLVNPSRQSGPSVLDDSQGSPPE